jgi:hypothetical protein
MATIVTAFAVKNLLIPSKVKSLFQNSWSFNKALNESINLEIKDTILTKARMSLNNKKGWMPEGHS